MILFSDFQNITEVSEESKVNFTFSNFCDSVSKMVKDNIINAFNLFLYVTQTHLFMACKSLYNSIVVFPVSKFYNKRP
jgi:hypothetical protein